MSDPSQPNREPVAAWRFVLAFFIDFFFAFIVFGLVIGWLSGDLTNRGFSLSGPPAAALFIAIVLYIVVGARLNIRIGWRLLGIRR